MRDPNRIDRLLATIEKIWKENPDLRLGQLILNACNESFLYYIEDSDLEKALELVYLKNNKK